MLNDYIFWHTINLAIEASPSIIQMFDYFEHGKDAWSASQSELKKAGMHAKTIQKFIQNKKLLDREKEYQKLLREEIHFITLKDAPAYPALLKQTFTPPPLLYFRGKLQKDIANTIAIVGSRKATPEGLKITKQLTEDLSRYGFTIVSGLALGIDSASHESALENSACTIAVLGCGITDNDIYPKTNLNLAHKIIKQNGCVLSEFPPGTEPRKEHFPRRNRIIAGLSLATIVVQATEKSGALHTAKFSAEENRDVFAVPGSIYINQHKGTNSLIQNGAHLLTNAKQVLDILNLVHLQSSVSRLQLSMRSKHEQLIIKALLDGRGHRDELQTHTELTTNELQTALTTLEIDSIVKQIGARWVCC